MSRYIAIATIRIEHDYYNPSVNRFVSLQPTPETKELMKRRGVMFRAVSANEWQWIMLDDLPGFMDEDVLELSMIVKDPCFLQQIENKGYDLGSLYKFNIENRVVEVNANYVWKKETNGQKLKDEFCRITLKPVETAPEKSFQPCTNEKLYCNVVMLFQSYPLCRNNSPYIFSKSCFLILFRWTESHYVFATFQVELFSTHVILIPEYTEI